MLFAIAVSLTFIRTWMELALVHRRCSRMLVVDVTITLLLRRPTICSIFAARVTTFPWPRMRLLMLTADKSASIPGRKGGRHTSDHKAS